METTNKREKKFDAVQMMREIRDKISLETQTMTFKEFKIYMDKKLEEAKSQKKTD
jgi:hypothetical protein